jgi:hypothetical protein
MKELLTNVWAGWNITRVGEAHKLAKVGQYYQPIILKYKGREAVKSWNYGQENAWSWAVAIEEYSHCWNYSEGRG